MKTRNLSRGGVAVLVLGVVCSACSAASPSATDSTEELGASSADVKREAEPNPPGPSADRRGPPPPHAPGAPGAPGAPDAPNAPNAPDAPEPRGKTCGGFAGIQCDKGQYCSFPEGAQCGAADRTGTCRPIPELCSKLYAPVCGCDGKTYSSACVAASNGVSVAKRGECAPPPDKLCGGIAGIQCDKGQYCNFPLEAKCGAGDQSGTCQATPVVCPDFYQGVCGCDGKTYPNACYAARNGVSIVSTSACVTPSK